MNSHHKNYDVIIIGAGHISQVLSKLSVAMDLDVTVIEPRSIFLSEKRFPNVATRLGWPQDILPELHVDEQTAIVTLTHDPKLDDPALQFCLKTNVFYIGCLGSNKTHNSRILRLKKKGFKDKEISKLHGPIGLSIGAKTPTEIAISIISQIIEEKNKFNVKASFN